MSTVPGNPKTVRKTPKKRIRIKTVRPAISKGDNYFFLLVLEGLSFSHARTMALATKIEE
jgi:hypothetical protein